MAAGEESADVSLSTIPVLERGILNLAKQVTSLSGSASEVLELPCLLLLNEEFNRASQQLIKASGSLLSKVSDSCAACSNPSVTAFLSQARDSLTTAMTALPGGNAESFSSFLAALLSDPQLQSKCPRNVFGFLTDVVLEDASTWRRLSAHIHRIYSRYSSSQSAGPAVSSDLLTLTPMIDSVSGLKLPLSKCLPRLLQCRRCHRLALQGRRGGSQGKGLLRGEQIFAAEWQNSLWKHRCKCGSLRRKIK